MIHIDFHPEKLIEPLKSEWGNWQSRAEQAIQEAVDAWEDWKERTGSSTTPPLNLKIAWREDIWRDLKEWLVLNVFHEKCAYCETPIVRFKAHAEHFRPKGRVTVKVEGRFQRQSTTDHQGGEIEHPGYFWLAYHWKNLLPSCGLCNSGEGKLDQFPVRRSHVFISKTSSVDLASLKGKPRQSPRWTDTYYLDPDDLDILEEPLLLNPYRDDPRKHLHFGFRGIEAPVSGSEKGEHSIEIYDLKQDRLRRARQKAQDQALNQFLAAYMSHRGDAQAKKLAARAEIADFTNGIEPYSAAACDWIEEVVRTLAEPAANSDEALGSGVRKEI